MPPGSFAKHLAASPSLLGPPSSILHHLRHATAPGLPFRTLAEDPPRTRNEEEEEEEKKSVAKPVSTKVTRRAMGNGEREARWKGSSVNGGRN